MLSLNDKTTGHIVKADGSLATVPTTLIGADTAAIIRAYFYWAMTHQLEPELLCGNCFDHTRDSKAKYNITDAEIQIVCGCQIRAFFGHSLPPARVAASTTIPNDGKIGQVLLSADAASLLRLYKKVLIELNLKEALRCNACYALSQSDGCAAQVTANAIQILCRCSDRRYAGMTI